MCSEKRCLPELVHARSDIERILVVFSCFTLVGSMCASGTDARSLPWAGAIHSERVLLASHTLTAAFSSLGSLLWHVKLSLGSTSGTPIQKQFGGCVKHWICSIDSLVWSVSFVVFLCCVLSLLLLCLLFHVTLPKFQEW